MRVRSHLLASIVCLLAAACSASGGGDESKNDTALTPTVPAPVPDAGKKTDASGSSDAATPPPKNACDLPEVVGAPTISPEFVIYASPAVVPPAMTGGALKGQYKVDKAKVYLPSASSGLVDPKKSTGTIVAWAIFDGTNYRLFLKADFMISSVAGPQQQAADSASQGGFTVSGGAITLDHACDGALKDEADYSFKDEGGGRATILIKTPTPYGDTYLQLDAAKN